MVALFAHRKGNRQAIARRWERASRIGSVRTGRILQMIEIEHKLAGFIEPVRRKARVQKAARSVRRRGAGGVAQNEEKFRGGIVFHDGLKLVGFSS